MQSMNNNLQKMKIDIKYIIVILLVVLINNTVYSQNRVDIETKNVLPLLHLDDEYQLSFSDEFNTTVVDTSKWNIDNSPKSRAARKDLQINEWYWVPENVKVENGELVLSVSKPRDGVMHCGSINSMNKYEVQYGYFETKIFVADVTKGTHTAFWLQGQDMETATGNAHNGAEIDVFESAWLYDYTKSNIHIDGYGSAHKSKAIKFNTRKIHDEYHIWGLLWTPDSMNIYYDGELKASYTDDKWLVHAKEYLWLSDGAAFGFTGNHFTKQEIGHLTEAYVDYIRVWTKEWQDIVETPIVNDTTEIINDISDKIATNPITKIISLDRAEQLKIISNQHFSNYSIINSTGKLITENQLHENTIDISSIVPGYYLLKLNNSKDNKYYHFRFIKK